jgi:hypothetical protein
VGDAAPTLDPQRRASRQARNSTVRAVDDWFVAVQGALAIEGRIATSDSVRLAAATETRDRLLA